MAAADRYLPEALSPSTGISDNFSSSAPTTSLRARSSASSALEPPSSPGHSAATTRQPFSFGLLSEIWATPNLSTQRSSSSLASSPIHQGSQQLRRQGRERHRSGGAASNTRSSLSSQPVLVRSHSGSRTANGDYPRDAPSRLPVPSHLQLHVARAAMSTGATLPPIEAFSFDGILRAVQPDIQEALDAIAEIYAKSRLSLADEHGAHLPPQGEILAAGGNSQATGYHQQRQHGPWRRLGGHEQHALTAVPEASSSSERLAGGRSSKASTASGRSKPSAYASLMNIMIRRSQLSAPSPSESHHDDSHVLDSSSTNHTRLSKSESAAAVPPIVLMASPTTSKQTCWESHVQAESAMPQDRQSLSSNSANESSLWLPWTWMTPAARSGAGDDGNPHDNGQHESGAEAKLKDLLRNSKGRRNSAVAYT